MSGEKRDSFVIYRSHIEALLKLPPELCKECFRALSEYALDGSEYAGSEPIAQMFYTMAKPQVDANNRRYANGKKGGRPRKDEKPIVVDLKPNETKQKPTESKEKPKADCESIYLNSGEEWKPDASEFAEYERLFPQINVKQEFAKMRAWSIANPDRRKTKTGIRRFVNSWLSKEQDRNGKGGNENMIVIPPTVYTDVPVAPPSEETLAKFKERQRRKGND